MNKKTIITALVALVAMSADAQRLNKDVERMQYVMPLKWSSTIASGVDLLISNMMYLYYIMAIPVAMWLILRRSSWLSIRQS